MVQTSNEEKGMIGLKKGEYENGMESLAAMARRGATMQASADASSVGTEGKDVCAACGFMWFRGGGDPAPRCPHCGSMRWYRRDMIRHSCNVCSHAWLSYSESPSRCPSCHSRLWNRDAEPSGEDDRASCGDVPADAPAADPTTVCDDERDFIRRMVSMGVSEDEAGLMYLIVSGIGFIQIARSKGVSFDAVMRSNAVLGKLSSTEGGLRCV